MQYRTLISAGAALGICAGSAVAQIQQQQRPGTTNGQLRQVLDNYLEGNWDIEVQVWSMADAQRETPTRPGARPGTQPGQQQQLQQIRTQIEQAMTRAGVDRQQATQQAQRLAQQFVQQRPQQQQIQQQLQQAMTQAGVSQQQAQQEAQRLSQQIHRMVQDNDNGDEPGIRPDDNDTATPTPGIRSGQQTRPGQQMRPGQQQGTLQAEGTANRSWTLDDNILEEEVQINRVSAAPADRPFNDNDNGVEENNNNQYGQQQRPGQQLRGQQQRDRLVQRLRDEESLEGQGLFGFDDETGMLFHVWTDSSQSKIFYSVGEYDQQQRTVTFHTANPQQIMNGMERPGTRPGMQPGQRPGQQPGQQPGTQPGQQQQLQQIRTQIQDALTEAGVDRQQAMQHAQRLAQQFVQQRPQQQQIQQQLQQAMTQAGVSQQEAQQEAQRLSQRIHSMVQENDNGDRPGLGQRPGMQMGEGERVVLRILDEDEHVVEYYRENPTGEAVRIMQVTYTRNN